METYEEFIAKFNIDKPKTTDDCYTPENVWNVILRFVCDKYAVKPEQIVRPFYPGGDFERENYDGRVVVDNPPFSIMKKIVKFYIDNDIKFFLFCNTLTPPIYDFAIGKVSIIIGGGITYTNGATVNTSFITNLESAGIVYHDDLFEGLKQCRIKPKKKTAKPDNYMLLPDFGVLARAGLAFSIPWDDVEGIKTRTPDRKQTFGKSIVLTGKSAEEYKKRRKEYEERKQNSI